ncbi:TPA: Ig-like domain-containing protein [Bacillus thuringiensis]|uniref:Ig-like domain-containing protein n=1 Tax=Bacillus thuringiensis TaxID=1428 RepID=UPI000BFD57CD|nr:Ig-like domain-containing protein [Bacillus thuringiensis]PGS64627.1 hypothetical protein COD07_27350 [Bacillus thuringiensis]HDX9688658.1 Ig-like domain-containing protein [Bacillus thuringiensis]
MLVHRLGKTDDQFKNKYNYAENEILLESEDIIHTLDELKFFAQFLIKNLEIYYPVSIPNDYVTIKLEILTDAFIDFLGPEYIIKKNKDRPKLSDILVEIRELDTKDKEIVLDGDYRVIRKYYKKLLKHEQKGLIKINSFTNNKIPLINNRKINLNEFSVDDFKDVLNRLPEGKWPKGIHKVIANELGLSNSKVSKIISILKEDHNITLQLSSSSLTINIGQTKKIEAFINSSTSTGRYLSWTSVDPNIVTVNEGKITGISKGNTEIIVKANAHCYKKCKINVNEQDA